MAQTLIRAKDLDPDNVKDARKFLRSVLKPGQTVYVVQRHVSSSGMRRYLSLFVGDGRTIRNITWAAAHVMGDSLHTYDGWHALQVDGTGMNMHFATVYNLGRALYPHGAPCTGFGRDYRPETTRGGYACRSNDHVNPGPHRDLYGRGRKHSDGGYAFRDETL